MDEDDFFQRNRTVVVAIVVAVLVGGAVYFLSNRHGENTSSASSSDADLTTDLSASLLTSYSIVNCPSGQVRFSNPSDFPVLDEWARQLVRNGYALTYSGPSRAEGGVDEDDFSYNLSGVSTIVKFAKYHQAWFHQYLLEGCLATPSSIKVLDTTLDPTGKQAVVTFTYGGASETKFASDMMAIAQPATATPLKQALEQWTGEHTAMLQRLDATGWRVDRVR